MNQNINYQKELDKILDGIQKSGETKTLLLHSCCAPCSSYVLEYLSKYFKITIFYYNPNIYPQEEFYKRVEEQKRLIAELPTDNKINFIEGKFDSERFYDIAKGLEKEKEGGERCFKCYELRLRETALLAKKKGFDYFTTTLSISPYKNAKKLNEIGINLSQEYNIQYLFSDFKKKNGYKRSIELSKQYNLYRQDYCGCVFSKQEREATLARNNP
ncbi:epoxyqueuosine reductase QueH [Clostridium sp. MSJ-8]|uniref:epoxyqueuosine reductase QueH n=1 Tax=Clostridium sp. MSJ-8 TaxID=2841510 RepID=UPI001C0F3124|nr:epoxyqueuosine reductase QueH [Clostridium sp. MSJ-8]MBU5488344.1 epoxyqueuosine reductase QueH [Clostridium sp. MSJ-8]